MSRISTWSTDQTDNQMPTPDGWPEGQAPSTVNNCARTMMASIRDQWNDAAWFDWGYNVSRVSGNSFVVTSATNSTVTLPAAFEANARIKLYDSTTIYGTITTVSASAASTLVTFDPDAFSLTSSFSSVYNSIIPATNTPIPGLSIPTDVVTQTTQQIYGVDNGATNSAHINLSPVLSGYVSGQLVLFKALQTNTGPMTIQIGALGNKTIKKNVSEDLASGDIESGQIVPLSYDGTNFQMVGGSGGSGSGIAVTREITQNSHGFVVGEVLYLNSGTYTKAIASSAAAAEVVGMVTEVIGTNSFALTTSGYVTGLSGLSSGNVYFVSPSSAGALTATEPNTIGQISKPVFVSDSTTSGYFINYRGMIVPSIYSPATVNTQTASYGLVVADSGSIVEMNVGSANNLTVPLNSTQAFQTGTIIDITQLGAGKTTVVATGGVTIRSISGFLSLNGQYSGATLYKRDTDEWVLVGNLIA